VVRWLLASLGEGTPRERAAVRWFLAGFLVVFWAAVFSWASYAFHPVKVGYAWEEGPPCHFRYVLASSWHSPPVSDAEAAGWGCPHQGSSEAPW
jgi:hypothetical protein